MLLNSRRVQWAGVAAILLVSQAGVLTTARQTGGEWTGTVTVERRASGTLRADDGATPTWEACLPFLSPAVGLDSDTAAPPLTDSRFSDVTDAEINAYTHGWTWPAGSANRQDWSCGHLSKQWTGKQCGA